MLKRVIAIIKKEDGILLLKRQDSRLWELPNGAAANGERMSAALKRELDRKFRIDAEVGKLITSLDQEIFVYDIKSYNNYIRLFEHDLMDWVPLYKVLEFNITQETKKIIMHMTNTKEVVKKSASLDDAISCIIEKPAFDTTTKQYVVKIKNHYIGETRSFDTEMQAMQFYIGIVRGILGTMNQQQKTK